VSLVVVKCGGAVAAFAAESVHGLVAEGDSVCVVHGAGPQISTEMERLGLSVRFIRGRRVTGASALEVVRESLAGVNAALCETLGPVAVGLMGHEVGLEARMIPELGFVGEPRPSSPPAVQAALVSGRIPVIAPLARGPLNVNADEAAWALAVGLGAERLLFHTDVPGVFAEGALLPSIEVDEADRMLEDGSFEGGIVPKLHAAVRAVRSGVHAEIGETVVLP
jgi:acetylglutamate kinase